MTTYILLLESILKDGFIPVAPVGIIDGADMNISTPEPVGPVSPIGLAAKSILHFSDVVLDEVPDTDIISDNPNANPKPPAY